MKKLGIFSVLFNLFVIFAVVVLAAFLGVNWYVNKDGDHASDTLVSISQGEGVTSISQNLVELGLISNANAFRALAIWEDQHTRLKYGEYEIPAGASMREILDILVDGNAVQLSVTIPEGWTSWQIVQKLNEVEDLEGEIKELPAEGSLAPNTYAFPKGTTRQALINQMMELQTKILDEAWASRVEDLPVESKEELLILASIIEKETGNAEERPLVAAVFINRLKKGMRLQTDPTIIYGITLGEGSLGRGIRKSELEAETPYNTYVIYGLPPTPISNPGASSIQAAANPAASSYIYFVAKTLNPSDGHNFAETLEEHNNNVAIYREAEASASE